MSQVFGPDTVAVTAYAADPVGVPDAYGMVAPKTTTTNVAGCRHRTLTVSELAEFDTNIGEEKWKTTCPPDAVFSTLKPGDTISVNGRKYVIDSGPKHHGDFAKPFKVTIISTRRR